MSYHLGIAHHFPSLHRQLTSPTNGSFPRTVPDEDLTEDSKDVLIERLNDLVSRLSKTHALDDGAVSAIHSQMDKIELIVRKEGRHHSPQSEEGYGSLNLVKEEDSFWAPPSPSQSLRIRLPQRPKNSVLSPREPRMSTAKAVKIANEAEELASRLTSAVAELLIRKEESDHIHDLLVTRAEKAAERILFLEYRISEMEDDFEANQSELKYLRIQLQAIEAQCSEYIPRNQDPLLVESIKNWKVDWEDIDRRSKARRKKSHVTPHHNHTNRTSISTPLSSP